MKDTSPNTASDHKPGEAADGAILTKAVLRAGDNLGLSNAALGAILGLSGATLTRMRHGAYALSPGSKAFELAVLFVRVYRALDALVGGDDTVAARWLKAPNTALDGMPAVLLQSVSGLTHVLAYLDARRALL